MPVFWTRSWLRYNKKFFAIFRHQTGSMNCRRHAKQRLWALDPGILTHRWEEESWERGHTYQLCQLWTLTCATSTASQAHHFCFTSTACLAKPVKAWRQRRCCSHSFSPLLFHVLVDGFLTPACASRYFYLAYDVIKGARKCTCQPKLVPTRSNQKLWDKIRNRNPKFKASPTSCGSLPPPPSRKLCNFDELSCYNWK